MKASQLMCPWVVRICWQDSKGCFISNFMIQVVSEKTLCSKGFISNFRDIFTWKWSNYNSYRFSYKFAFMLFLFLLIYVCKSRCYKSEYCSFNVIANIFSCGQIGWWLENQWRRRETRTCITRTAKATKTSRNK